MASRLLALVLLLAGGTPAFSQPFTTFVAERCRSDLWNLSQVSGWQMQWPAMAERIAVDTPEARKAALEQWSAFPAVLDQEEQTMRKGLREGFSSPKPVVARVRDQIKGLAELSPDDSPLWSPMRRSDDEAFKQQWEALASEELVPAIRHYLAFLTDTYLPAARNEIGLSAVPNGQLCYQRLVQRWTTLDTPPEALRRIGEAQMDTLMQRLDALAHSSFGTTADTLMHRFRRGDVPDAFTTGEQVEEHARQAIARVRTMLPQLLNDPGNMDVVVRPIPAHLAADAPAGFYQGAAGPEAPGVYLINTSRPEQRRLMSEAIAFHETIPGHHLQSRLRPGGDAFNAGFAEGWAIYAEHLADEVGAYSSPLDRAGMIVKHMWATSRLIVDPGIHVFGWTRQQAIDYMRAHTTLSPEEIAVEVDRYIALPGQSLSYMLGYLEIHRLRRMAEEVLGDRFDVKAFHDVVLRDGDVTLPQLATNVRAWIDATLGTDHRATDSGSRP